MGPHDEVSQATETTESTLNYSLNPRIAGRQRSRRARTLATAVISALALVMGTLAAPAASASESLDAATAYVSAVYADLFHRAPDADGLRTWSAALISGTPRVAVANSITASDEYRSRLIVGSYREYLGRGPDAAGLQYWLTYLREGKTLQQMEAGFLAADEYYARAGSTPAGWVSQLYDNVLGRTPSQDEVSGWVSILTRGSSRGAVALGFLLSSEHLRTVVDGYYVDLLGRSTDASGADTWVSAIQRGTRLEQVIGSIVSSTEYINSHGSTNSSPAPPAASGVGVPAGSAPSTATHERADQPAPSALASPTPTTWSGGYGLFEDTQYLTGTALSARLDEYKAVGVQWARFQLLWSTIQSGGPTSYDWKPVDDLVAGLLARGIRPIAVIGTTPSWASRPAGCAAVTCAPADPAQFAAFAARASARYAPRGVHTWEVWNEPNSATFWKPAPDVASYTVVLKQTYAAIKAADPLATVITGGVAPAVTTSWSIAPLEFLAGIYFNGGQGSFDGVGWHPYTYPRMPGTVDNGDAWYQMYGPANSARAQMTANGDAAKKIWATEFGAHTDPLGEGYVAEAGQAEMFRTGLTLWASYPWAGPMIGYMLRDRGTDTADRENFFGLTRYDGSPKPANTTFTSLVRDFAASHPTF